MTDAATSAPAEQVSARSDDAAALIEHLMLLRREVHDLAARDADTEPDGRIWASVTERLDTILTATGGPTDVPTAHAHLAGQAPEAERTAFRAGWRAAHHDARASAATYLGHPQPTGLGWGPDDVVVDGDWLLARDRELDRANATIARVRTVVATLPTDAQDALNAVLAPRPLKVTPAAAEVNA